MTTLSTDENTILKWMAQYKWLDSNPEHEGLLLGDFYTFFSMVLRSLSGERLHDMVEKLHGEGLITVTKNQSGRVVTIGGLTLEGFHYSQQIA